MASMMMPFFLKMHILRLATLWFALISALLPVALEARVSFPVYIGAGTGVARYTGAEVEDPLLLAGQRLEDDQIFYEVYLGVDLTDWFAIELAVASFGEFKDKYRLSPDVVSIVTPNDEEQVDASRVSLMGVLSYPLTMGFSVYVTGGYAYYNFEQFLLGSFAPDGVDLTKEYSGDAHVLEYGFGARYEIIDRVSVRGQWTESLMDDRKLQSNRVSVELHF